VFSGKKGKEGKYPQFCGWGIRKKKKGVAIFSMLPRGGGGERGRSSLVRSVEKRLQPGGKRKRNPVLQTHLITMTEEEKKGSLWMN